VTEDNVGEYGAEFARWIKTRHSKTCTEQGCGRGAVYRSRHHLAVWGSDYLFTRAESMYSNMEKIVAHVNAQPSKYGIRVQYTTLSRYSTIINKENQAAKLALPLKRDVDFEFGWCRQYCCSCRCTCCC